MLLGFGSEAAYGCKGLCNQPLQMFLPANIVATATPATQAVIAIVCVSEILFFSASIPCILGTDIKLSLKDILIIWFERVVLSLILATPVVHLLLRCIYRANGAGLKILRRFYFYFNRV